MISPAKNQSGLVTVLLDGQPRRVPAAATLADLVGQLGHAPEGVSTALNGEFVPRAERAARVLAEGDAVLLFQPIVGG
ncbi:MAG: sulfur carrier protein ThiS [Burkholderiaceae bacterium]|jgi:sulfur carrier protein|nr:sulfur carrier protein ThiS [Burkholderiaceae bacterium]